MSRSLDNLCAVPGVKGAGLYEPEGRCVESRLVAPYDPEFVGELLFKVVRGLDTFAETGNDLTRAALVRAEHGCIGVLRLEHHVVLALTEATIDPRQLWVAFGALEARLSRRAASFVSASDLPAQTADPEVVAAIEAALSQAVGPVARVLLQQEVATLERSPGGLGEAELPELVRRLEQAIDQPVQRRAFRAQVGAMLSNSRSDPQ